MFERFTRDARVAVVEAQDRARRRGAADIRAVHLLLAIAAGTGPAADALRGRGADPAAVAAELDRLTAPVRADDDRPLDEIDHAALAGLGIDLDAIRAATEARFGPGALERPRLRRRGLATRLRRGGSPSHLPFHDGTKSALELSLKEALRLGDREIDATHLLLALLRADDPQVRSVLFTLGVDPADLRAELEDRRPRSA